MYAMCDYAEYYARHYTAFLGALCWISNPIDTFQLIVIANMFECASDLF